MLNLRHSQHGVTLIELMIAVVLMGILLMLAAPGYSTWIQNQQIRAGAESILNGIQLARSTAVNNNAPTRFNLCDTASSWQVLAASSTAAAADPAVTPCAAGAAVGAGNEVRVQYRSSQNGSRAGQIYAISGVSTTVPVVDDTNSRNITFNSFGRVVANDAAIGGNSISTIEVATQQGGTQVAGTRPLLVIVQPGGNVRMCDPAAPANDPRKC